MDDSARAPDPAVPTPDEVAWLSRLAETRATMDGLRRDTARVSGAIAATERAVAGTLRTLADDDREQGRDAAADRREARARDAERFAAQEDAVAADLTAAAGRAAPESTRVHTGS